MKNKILIGLGVAVVIFCCCAVTYLSGNNVEQKVNASPSSISRGGVYTVTAGNYPTYLMASAIVSVNGDILVFTYQAQSHASHHGAIWMYRSSDGGYSWDAGTKLFDRYNTPAGSNYMPRNPIVGILHNGRILLGFAQYMASMSADNVIYYSDDNGNTFNYLSSVPFSTCYFTSAGNILQYSSYAHDPNEIIIPCENTQVTPNQAVFMASVDDGKTWQVRSILDGRLFNEPTITWAEDGSLKTVIRADGTYWTASSSNKGATWTTPVNHPELKGTQPSLGIVDGKYVLASRRLAEYQPTSMDFYASSDFNTWTRTKSIMRSQQRAFDDYKVNCTMNYGSFVDLGAKTLFFFTSEHSTATNGIWWDSGVFYIEIDKDYLE